MESEFAGRYRLLEQLGQGTMGSVWLGEHLQLGSRVAIKIISADYAQHPEAHARFYREAMLAAKLQSAHVVKVVDFGQKPSPYIVMEYLRGESLRERLAVRGRLPAAETVTIITHVCRAMTVAHDLGLVHRDVKPANIFLVRHHEDEDEIAKVLDFGVAKAPDFLKVAGADPTRTGTLLGTPYYMSPEQVKGLKTLDARSDLWSVGVVCFECLTGQRPFRASGLGTLLNNILGAPIPSVTEVLPGAGLGPMVDAFMSRALEREPDKRFASAKELAAGFRDAVRGL